MRLYKGNKTKKHFQFVSDKLLMLSQWQYEIALFVSSRNRIKICLTLEIHHCLKLRKTDDAEAVTVVTVTRTTAVTIRHPAVPRIAAPAATAEHAVRA